MRNGAARGALGLQQATCFWASIDTDASSTSVAVHAGQEATAHRSKAHDCCVALVRVSLLQRRPPVTTRTWKAELRRVSVSRISSFW